MIVGAKGGKLQLTLNTVYYLSQPIENMPYDYLRGVSSGRPARRKSCVMRSSRKSWDETGSTGTSSAWSSRSAWATTSADFA